jgi:5-methylcytosine-specific restriction endonuclease McrA
MSRSEWRGGLDWDVFVRDKYTCRYCGLHIKTVNGQWDLFVADHLKPQSVAVGGPDTIMNLVTACMGCNRLKGGFDPTEGGPAPDSKEEQERLVEKANTKIKERRDQFTKDAQEMQRQASTLR